MINENKNYAIIQDNDGVKSYVTLPNDKNSLIKLLVDKSITLSFAQKKIIFQ